MRNLNVFRFRSVFLISLLIGSYASIDDRLKLY